MKDKIQGEHTGVLWALTDYI